MKYLNRPLSQPPFAMLRVPQKCGIVRPDPPAIHFLISTLRTTQVQIKSYDI